MLIREVRVHNRVLKLLASPLIYDHSFFSSALNTHFNKMRTVSDGRLSLFKYDDENVGIKSNQQIGRHAIITDIQGIVIDKNDYNNNNSQNYKFHDKERNLYIQVFDIVKELEDIGEGKMQVPDKHKIGTKLKYTEKSVRLLNFSQVTELYQDLVSKLGNINNNMTS